MNSLIYHIIVALVRVLSPAPTQNAMEFVETDFITFNKKSTYLDSLHIEGTNTSIITEYNFALAYFSAGDTAKASDIAQRIIRKESGLAKTQSYLLLSKLALQQKDTAQAINWLSDGIIKTKRNSELLYNFELLKRKFKNSQQQPPQGPQNNSNSDMSQNSLAEKSDKKEDDLESSTPPKISRKQALQILETLKEKEILFIPKTSQNLKDSTLYGKL